MDITCETEISPELEACVAAVMAETGWSREFAVERIEDCRARLGISYDDYLSFQMYLAAPKEYGSYFEKMMKKRVKTNRARIACLAAVKEATGWTEEEALAKIEACMAAYGIGYADYQELALWEKTPEEQEAVCAEIVQQQKAEKRDRRKCIAAAMEAMHWSEKLATEMIEDCRNRLGVSYRDYRKLELYRMSDAEQRKAYHRQLRKRERTAQELEACVAAAVEAMGWPAEEATETIKAARKELGIPYRVYHELQLWDKEPERQAEEYESYKLRKEEEKEKENDPTA